MRNAKWALLVFTVGYFVGNGPATAADGTPKLLLSRADLANAYLRFDHAFTNSPPPRAQVADINRQFDTETKAFFGGNLAQVARGVHALAERVLYPGKTFPNQPFVNSLKVMVEPRAHVKDSNSPIVVWIRSVYKVDPMPTTDVPLTLLVKDQNGKTIAKTDIIVPPVLPAENPLRVELPVAASKQPIGKYSLELTGAGAHEVTAGNFFIVPFDLDATRASNETRLSAVSPSNAALEQALSTCKARNALLTNHPSESNSAEFLADPNALSASLQKEIADLEKGNDPYAGRQGDYWRVIKEGDIAIPARVFAPASIQGKKEVPLVVAFHGAGGDENMFMDAYGAGKLKQLAEEKGFLAVSPATFYFATHGKYLDRVIEAVGYNYPIDKDRIYVIGHSMGGGAAAFQAKAKADVLAAACCLAGGRGFPTSGSYAPTLVIAAELDGIVPVAMLQTGAEKSRDAGLPVEYRLLKDFGHTLMVGDQLPTAIDWLLAHARLNTSSAAGKD